MPPLPPSWHGGHTRTDPACALFGSTACTGRDALALGEKDIGKQINKTNSENTEGDFPKRPVRLTKPESENNEDDIRKQNQKTGKRTSENGLDTTKKQKTKEKSRYDSKP